MNSFWGFSAPGAYRYRPATETVRGGGTSTGRGFSGGGRWPGRVPDDVKVRLGAADGGPMRRVRVGWWCSLGANGVSQRRLCSDCRERLGSRAAVARRHRLALSNADGGGRGDLQRGGLGMGDRRGGGSGGARARRWRPSTGSTWCRGWPRDGDPGKSLPARRTATTRDHFAAQCWLGGGVAVIGVASSRSAHGEQKNSRRGSAPRLLVLRPEGNKWAAGTARHGTARQKKNKRGKPDQDKIHSFEFLNLNPRVNFQI